jgi:hypothetical protein
VPVHWRHVAPADKYAGHAHALSVHVCALSIGPHWLAQGGAVDVIGNVAIPVLLSNSEKQMAMLLEMLLLAVALTVPVHWRHVAPADKYAGQAHVSLTHVAACIMGAQALVQRFAGVVIKGVASDGARADVGNKITQSCAAAMSCWASVASTDWTQVAQVVSSEAAAFKTPHEHVTFVPQATNEGRKGHWVGQTVCRRTNPSSVKPSAWIAIAVKSAKAR